MSSSKPSTDRALAVLSGILNVGCLVVDAAGEFVVANPSACELLGCADDAALNARWATVATLLGVDPEGLPPTAKPLRRAVDVRVGTVERQLRLEIHELAGAAGWLVLLKERTVVDTLDAGLLLASRMHTQAYLHGAFRHALKTPLNSMRITLELLAETVSDAAAAPASADPAALRRYVKVLRDDVLRLDRTLHAGLGQALSAEVHAFDLGDVVREIAARLESHMQHQGVALQLRLPAGAVTLHGAEDWLKQALLNIAVYRLDAMPDRGRLSIECDAQERSVTISISGDGAGVPAPTLDALYRVAFTAGESWAAMGLYLARVVVESLGGEFRVETGADRGTCFRLSLPRRSSSSPTGC